MSGSSLNLTCVAIGSPMPHVKWQRGTEDVSPEITPPIGKNVLQLHNIQKSANFTCVAGSKLGVIDAKTLVKVQGECASPNSHPEKALKSIASSTTEKLLIGFHATTGLVRREKVCFLQQQVPLIKSFSRQRLNSSMFKADNAVSDTISALPLPPTKVKISDVTPTSVHLSWSYPGSPNEVQYYVIQYKPKLASWDYKEISGAITNFYDIRGLTPYTEYEFVVLAVNNVGRGDKSRPVVATTGETGEQNFFLSSFSSLPLIVF
jgi:hypothetical protein